MWHLACRHGDLFAAYAPVAYVIWEPAPTGAALTPWRYSIPMAFKTDRPTGSAARGAVASCKDVFEHLDVLRRTNQCRRDERIHGARGFSGQSGMNAGCRGSLLPSPWRPWPAVRLVRPALDWFETVRAR